MNNLESDTATLIEYGRKMLELGDSWRSVRSYLVNKTSDEAKVNQIVKTLSELEREGHIIQTANKAKGQRKKLNIILGLFLMGLGVFLFSFLWFSGWIAVLPLLIFVAGLVVINGGNPASLFRRL